MRRSLALAVALCVSRGALAETHEFEVGVEDFDYLTRPSLLNLSDVLHLGSAQDILRGTLHATEAWDTVRLRLSGYVETHPVGAGPTLLVARELYAEYSFGPGLTLRAGKQRVDWGSGLAWNPTNRIEPPRNPFNTALEEEGVLGLRADFVPAPWAGLVVLAARSDTRPGDLPFPVPGGTATSGAIRARFLVKDTDLALVLSGGTNTHRLFGLDVGRNLGSLAVHAEGALSLGPDIPSARRDAPIFRLATGLLETRGSSSYSLEYFLNGDGFDGPGYGAYVASLKASFARASDPTLPTAERETALGTYLGLGGVAYEGLGLRRRYLHAAWSRGEIRGRWTLSAQALFSLSDSSLALTPGLSLAARDDLTLSLNGVILLGESESEYRLAPIRGALEGRVRLLF